MVTDCMNVLHLQYHVGTTAVICLGWTTQELKAGKSSNSALTWLEVLVHSWWLVLLKSLNLLEFLWKRSKFKTLALVCLLISYNLLLTVLCSQRVWTFINFCRLQFLFGSDIIVQIRGKPFRCKMIEPQTFFVIYSQRGSRMNAQLQIFID